MEEKETIEKDVDLLDDITKFTVLPPKRERNKEEEEPVSKGSRILSLVYVSIGAALALAYLVLAFVFGRRWIPFRKRIRNPSHSLFILSWPFCSWIVRPLLSEKEK